MNFIHVFGYNQDLIKWCEENATANRWSWYWKTVSQRTKKPVALHEAGGTMTRMTFVFYKSEDALLFKLTKV